MNTIYTLYALMHSNARCELMYLKVYTCDLVHVRCKPDLAVCIMGTVPGWNTSPSQGNMHTLTHSWSHLSCQSTPSTQTISSAQDHPTDLQVVGQPHVFPITVPTQLSNIKVMISRDTKDEKSQTQSPA